MPRRWNERDEDLQRSGFLLCPTCNGSGKVVAGYGVVCTELIEKFAKCTECGGKGYSKRHNPSKKE